MQANPASSLLANASKVKKEYKVSILVYWFFAFFVILIGVILYELNYRLEGAAIAILGFAPLFIELNHRLFDHFLLGPLLFTYIFHSFGYSIGPLWQVYIVKQLDPIVESFIPAQWGCVIGLITLGIFFPLFFKLGRKIFITPKQNALVTKPQLNWRGYAIILLAVTIITILVGFVTGVANRLASGGDSLPLSSLVSTFSGIGIVTFFFLSYASVRYRGAWGGLWFIAYIIFALFNFLDGSRGAPIYAAIFSAIGWVWAGIPTRRLIIVGLIASILFIPIVGIVQLYRDEYAYLPDRISIDARIEGLLRAFVAFNSQSKGSLAKATESFASGITAKTVDRIFLLSPQYIPYAGLEGINNIIYAFVPQLIKQDRPVLIDGNEIAIRYGAVRASATGAYTPTVGDGYRRAGWIGIFGLYLLISLAYGIFTAVCWERRERREWMAMFIFLNYQSPGMWSTTLLSLFYFILWLVPRNFITFWLLRILQDVVQFKTYES